MSRTRNGRRDEDLQRIVDALTKYRAEHPRAEVQVYRQNSVSIRIRIIDASFKGMDRVDRDELVWTFLDQLPEEVQSQITFLLLLTPSEAKTSFGNAEFEHPVPSRL